MIERRVVNMKRLALLTALLLAAVAFVGPVSASLVPMSWGFPVLIQNNSITGLQTASASAMDFEAADISFPSTGFGGSGGLFGGAFPSISQIAHQGASQSALAFANQNQNMIFAYPFISIGGSPIPSMGFP